MPIENQLYGLSYDMDDFMINNNYRKFIYFKNSLILNQLNPKRDTSILAPKKLQWMISCNVYPYPVYLFTIEDYTNWKKIITSSNNGINIDDNTTSLIYSDSVSVNLDDWGRICSVNLKYKKPLITTIAEECILHRKKNKNEKVVLVDGNNYNLTLDNIKVFWDQSYVNTLKSNIMYQYNEIYDFVFQKYRIGVSSFDNKVLGTAEKEREIDELFKGYYFVQPLEYRKCQCCGRYFKVYRYNYNSSFCSNNCFKLVMSNNFYDFLSYSSNRKSIINNIDFNKLDTYSVFLEEWINCNRSITEMGKKYNISKPYNNIHDRLDYFGISTKLMFYPEILEYIKIKNKLNKEVTIYGIAKDFNVQRYTVYNWLVANSLIIKNNKLYYVHGKYKREIK